ncbi:MAG: DUF4493 domain-containing protein [Muribaculaceae bacterium]|nr:DUF4493 domain-containing protein [Muribaculaceae bacterium]
MKKIFSCALVAATMLAGACSKESPYNPEDQGMILRSALSMDVRVDPVEHLKITGTRADEISPDDFTVVFTLSGQSVPAATYKYAEMPEVITLPVGTYTCSAYYGDDLAAEWDNPYYVGTSVPFEVSAFEITSYIDPIECRLENVQVSIEFDPFLKQAMSADSYVEVKVGDVGSLLFGVEEASSGKCGFFRHTAESTLVAVFNGDVNGVRTVESKSMNDIEKGNHYRILFKLHDHDGNDSGDSDASVSVDASVTVTDVELGVDTIEDEVLDDNERPREDGEEPGQPDQPTPPDVPQNNGPQVSVSAPFEMDTPYLIDCSDNEFLSNVNCVIKVVSDEETGIQAFTCDIDSNLLTADLLGGMGIPTHLDLAETDPTLANILSSFEFPTNVKGNKSADLDLSQFVEMMANLVAGAPDRYAEFKITVRDTSGTVSKSLIFQFK